MTSRNDVRLRATAAAPIFYRRLYGGEMFDDVGTMITVMRKHMADGTNFTTDEIRTVNSLAVAMAMSDGADPGELMRQVSSIDAVQLLMAVYAAWEQNVKTTVDRLAMSEESRKSGELNTAMFILRCIQSGISISDLPHLTVGMVLDVITEQQNESDGYEVESFDNF